MDKSAMGKAELQVISTLEKLVDDEQLQDVYLVGGCVRDLILGRPTFDFDVSCPPDVLGRLLSGFRFELASATAHPLRFERDLQPLVIQEQPSQGVQVLSLKLTHVTDQEVAVKVDFRPLKNSSLEDDALSRDFTFNSIFYSLGKKQMVDPAGVR